MCLFPVRVRNRAGKYNILVTDVDLDKWHTSTPTWVELSITDPSLKHRTIPLEYKSIFIFFFLVPVYHKIALASLSNSLILPKQKRKKPDKTFCESKRQQYPPKRV